jgi:alkylation response protein AidB-like acyl-CoA dehydrogenase
MSSVLAKSDDERLLADTVGRFAETANEFELRRRRLAEASPKRMAIWPELAALGILGTTITESAGGLGEGAGALSVVMEALGASLVVEPVLAIEMSARVIEQADDACRKDLLPGVLSGESVVIIAHQEGGDPFAEPTLAAVRTASGYRLTGSKPAVRHGDHADVFLLSARLVDGEIALFLLPRNAAGVVVRPLRLIDDAGAADLILDGVEVAEEARLIPGNGVMAVLADVTEWGLTGLMAETVGIISRVNRATFDYLAARKQFGVPLASFQALRHRAADMVMAAEEAAAMATTAITALSDPPSASRSRTILSASLACDAGGRLVGHEAVQLHGGMGVSDELAISHFARRLAAIRYQFGSGDLRRARLAGLLGGFA